MFEEHAVGGPISAVSRRTPRTLARRWRALAAAWDLEAVNALIGRHNDWFPIERDLAMDPRTGDYVKVHGRSYRRPELTPEWILEQFPAEPGP